MFPILPKGSQPITNKDILDGSITNGKFTPPKDKSFVVYGVGGGGGGGSNGANIIWPNGTQVEFQLTDYPVPPSKELKEQRKKEGRCEECGDLLPMSIWGLGDCPKHPKPTEGYK